MARNGAGTYTLPAGNPVTTGTTISSSWANNTLNDIASGLTTSLAYDGQTAPVANLPMATYAHTNVGNATVRTMYAAAGQVQDGTLTYLTSVSGTDTITALAPVTLSAYVTGQTFRFIASGANTTTSVTLNINSIGAKNITKNGTTALAANDILSGSVVIVTYDGTQFQLANPATLPVSVSSFNAGTTGFTPSTATTGAVTLAGTLNVANGGTGATTLTSGSLVVGNGTSAVSLLAAGLAGNVLTSNGTTWSSASKITSSTVQTASSSASITFSSIPSWVKRITIMLSDMVYSGTLQVQIGSGSTTTTGYVSASGLYGGSNIAQSSYATNCFIIKDTGGAGAANAIMILNNFTGNTWLSEHNWVATSSYVGSGAGKLALSGALDRIVISASTGNLTSGSINISYE